VVLKDKVAVKASDIKPITAHALHEARPPQPLNRRFVLRSFE
jgi:carbonic anhydrase